MEDKYTTITFKDLKRFKYSKSVKISEDEKFEKHSKAKILMKYFRTICSYQWKYHKESSFKIRDRVFYSGLPVKETAVFRLNKIRNSNYAICLIALSPSHI